MTDVKYKGINILYNAIIIWIYYVILMTSSAEGRLEHQVSYKRIFRSCDQKDVLKCDFKRERICVEYLDDVSSWSAPYVCKSGIFFEELKECPKFEEPDFCVKEFELINVKQSCNGKCDGNKELIEYVCSSNKQCIKTTHRHCQCKGVLGAWSEWGEYGECSATCDGGVKTRTRYKCYNTIDNGVTTDCGLEKVEDTSTTECNIDLCKTTTITKASTTPTTPIKLPEVPTTKKKATIEGKRLATVGDCNIICAANDQTTSVGIAEKCGVNLTDGNCVSQELTYSLTCDKSETCTQSNIGQPGSCKNWKPWSIWNEDSEEYGIRSRICVYASNRTKPSGDCQQEVTLEIKCKDPVQQTTELIATEPSKTKPWLIPVIVCLVCIFLLICCCGLWFCFMGKKSRKKKKDRQEPETYTDDVFITNGQTNQNRLNVMNRIERISEHVYEAISMRGSRLFSRPSTADEGAAPIGHAKLAKSGNTQHLYVPNERVENEYVSDDENKTSSFPSLPDCGLEPIVTRSHAERNDILRVSVMITDPDGKEVIAEDGPPEIYTDQDNSTPSSPLLPAPRMVIPAADYVAMNNEQSPGTRSQAMMPSATQRKKQWDRVPSPPSTKSSKPNYYRPDQVEEGIYKSSPEPKPLSVIKSGIMNMLQHVRKSPASGEHTSTHRYDQVSPDISSGTDRTGPVYIPSAPPSVSDNVSMWSDSTFESNGNSDRESPDSPFHNPDQEERKKTKIKRRTGRKNDSHQKNEALLMDPMQNTLGLSNSQASSAEYLTPNNRRLASVQYLSPRPGNPLNARFNQKSKDQSSPTIVTLATGSSSNDTYLQMNKDRATVKSWLNLGPAPDPVENNKDYQPIEVNEYCSANIILNLKNKDAKQIQREQSLDEKYTTSPVHQAEVEQARPSVRDLPTDSHGYFNLGFPGPPAQRVNTAEAQKAVKSVIRTPIMPRK